MVDADQRALDSIQRKFLISCSTPTSYKKKRRRLYLRSSASIPV
ncbi:hypothetical protein ACPOL_6686 [Acidisarcina polymorpha]|uniref:Uncharacterized protein n=1 Tax=Acidisarcina polymorpha TaxID=2211140 RepID=A0A2Z5GA66_9BACT|nr:hypothetical protein ACPOL_6686 [Acidisarcina polymorpha]